jgi:hypothetical protein
MKGVGMWGVGAWALLALGVGALVRAATTPFGAPRLSSTHLHQPPQHPFTAFPDSLAIAVVSHDPFRASRRPAEVAYDPLRAASPAPSDAAPKPALVLAGIVWGTVPEAVLEGIPGIEGSRLVRVRDLVAGLRVKRIERDRVVITGMDTVWTLRVREPWN